MSATGFEREFASVAALHLTASAEKIAREGRDTRTSIEGDDVSVPPLPAAYDLAIVLTEAFAQILFECRGALDYGSPLDKTHLLAGRVIDAVDRALENL